MPSKHRRVNLIYHLNPIASCSVKSDKKEPKREEALFFVDDVGKFNLLYAHPRELSSVKTLIFAQNTVFVLALLLAAYVARVCPRTHNARDFLLDFFYPAVVKCCHTMTPVLRCGGCDCLPHVGADACSLHARIQSHTRAGRSAQYQ